MKKLTILFLISVLIAILGDYTASAIYSPISPERERHTPTPTAEWSRVTVTPSSTKIIPYRPPPYRPRPPQGF